MGKEVENHGTPSRLPNLATRERIIVALDCPAEQARALARQLKDEACWLKVGMTLYYATGPQIVGELRELGFRVFVDLKLHDIPHQVRGAAASIVRAGADMLTVHALGGTAMLKAAGEGVREAAEGLSLATQPTLLAITVLTSMDDASLQQVGIAHDPLHEVIVLTELAHEAGCDGVVCSPREAQYIRASWGPEAAIVTPGVRPAGADRGDQSRVATPSEALRAGASHLVIGRPITAAADPRSAFEEIVRSINESDRDTDE
ncbi:MAG: orotidine-5'-phosphate decarboxylase [Coriobacteriales bacterium]|nr:orotidine-5'-phosphate decarboxylase [Coriobacteriales bacterium]